MGKTQYTQKFREEWLTDPLFKDWLMKIELDQNKARCRFCKTEVVAKRYDLVQHTKTKKHIVASKAFATSRSITSYSKPTSSKTSDAEGTLALFIAVHCSILTCDHLGVLCKSKFIDSEAAKNIKLHRTKCTNIITNILSPHFETSLRASIGNQPYSILVDESTDISVMKYLGITIMYFNKELGKLTSTYLAIVEMESCDAEAITIGIKTTLQKKGLDLKHLIGIGTDNASVMVGINNGVYKKLKEDIPTLIHVPCICHSLQLAVSAAANETLPRNIEYMIRETYNWFSHSALRQTQYKTLFRAINDGHEPLNIVKACDTRWLSIETAVSRILTQWLELKTLFGIAKLKEKCYAADILHNMFVDDRNLAYLKFLHPVLEEVQRVNKSFESNTADPSKLLNDLINLVNSIAKRFIIPDCRQNVLTCNMDSYAAPNVYFGFEFNQVLSKLPQQDQIILKERCVQFLKVLLKQLQQRLPKNVEILKKVSLLSPKSALSVIKESLIPLAELFLFDAKIIDKINIQWNNLTNIQWIQTNNTISFWKEVCDYTDASGLNPYEELCTLAIRLLVLPWSNADVERLFSQMNIIKSKLRNRMGSKLLDSILTIKSGLKRQNICCENYSLPKDVLKQISMPSFSNENSKNTSENTTQEEENMLIDAHLDLSTF